jgi:hypothetical protein
MYYSRMYLNILRKTIKNSGRIMVSGPVSEPGTFYIQGSSDTQQTIIFGKNISNEKSDMLFYLLKYI